MDYASLTSAEEYWCNVSEAARDFVTTCLTVDPEARPTAEQMPQHSWLTAEVPHFVEAANGEPTDLLPHVRKAFNARRTCTFRFRFVPLECILITAPARAVRKAVFSMMAMKRMSILAHHLTPEHRQLNEDVFQFKQESEKESLEHVDVLHHHNADSHSPDGTAFQPNASSEGTGQPRAKEEATITLESVATGSGPPSDHVPSVVPAETVQESKEVTEKLAAVSLAASAKVSGAAKRA